MREFKGVKPSLAQELTGFAGTPKMFRDRYRSAEAKEHQRYSAEQIRQIRMDLMGIAPTAVRPTTIPPIVNARMSKGGVGKTTVSGNIAACFAISGYKTLLIDGDPQSSTSTLYGVSWRREDILHIGELMKRAALGAPTEIASAVKPILTGGMLDLIPSDITMAEDTWLLGVMNREFAFQRLLETELAFFSQYDVIVIDSAPGASLLATTFMVASKTLLAVVSPEQQAIDALDVLDSNVTEINNAFARHGIDVDVQIVVNKYNQAKKPHGIALGQLLAKYSTRLNDTIIRDFVGFLRETDTDSIHTNAPVLMKEPNSSGARDIINLSKSLALLYDLRIAGVGLAGQVEEAA